MAFYISLGKLLLSLFLLIKIIQLQALQRVNLGGVWVLSNQNGNVTNIPATVPGGIYTDLMNNKVIDDVFYGDNDVNTRWVSKTNWTYSRIFIVQQDLLKHDYIQLIFKGLDTFSTVLINNVKVGTTNNMFVRYIFLINDFLKVGPNNITVEFESPVEKAQKLYDQQSKRYIVPPMCWPTEYRGECHINHIRKMQASFAWDWGPALPSVGIWKAVFIEAYNSTVIRDITVKTVLISGTWKLRFKIYFSQSKRTIKGKLHVKLFTDESTITKVSQLNVKWNKQGEFVYSGKISVPQSNVQKWWPNGYGNATLYTFKVIYISENEAEHDIKRLKIGFRTVHLNQHKYDVGRAFYFVVNGIKIFAKGSNIIPIDILPEKGQNATTIRFLLQSAKDVHMNMLRVWGGGVYESDEFYNVADELGILIWQDFMFACNMYPADEEFLSTVKREVEDQVKRLQHHASIILWAGNNENEAALIQNWYGTSKNFKQYKQDYIDLYVNTIKPLVMLYDGTRDFLTSSPTNGIESDKNGSVAENPQDPLYGDVHFYNYVHDSWNPNIYPIPRFASEYGYQSLPKLDTLLTITDDIKNLIVDGDLMNNRQHHFNGYSEMYFMTILRLQLPNISNAIKYLKTLVYYGQIMQAMAIKIETEHYRRWQSNLDSEHRGKTSGALYWQLNDVWVAPTWAGIDYHHNWKMLHYFAKDFFAPVIVTSEISNNTLGIYVANDKVEQFYDVAVKIDVYRWNTIAPLTSEFISIPKIESCSSIKVTKFDLDTYLETRGCAEIVEETCFLYLSLFDNEHNSLAPNNYVFPAPLTWADIKTPNLKVVSVELLDNGKTFKIQIKTDIIALFVWLDTDGIRGRFSENGFLQVLQTKEVQFSADSVVDLSTFKASLIITHLKHPQYIE